VPGDPLRLQPRLSAGSNHTQRGARKSGDRARRDGSRHGRAQIGEPTAGERPEGDGLYVSAGADYARTFVDLHVVKAHYTWSTGPYLRRIDPVVHAAGRGYVRLRLESVRLLTIYIWYLIPIGKSGAGVDPVDAAQLSRIDAISRLAVCGEPK
jgi:hypothetical protein